MKKNLMFFLILVLTNFVVQAQKEVDFEGIEIENDGKKIIHYYKDSLFTGYVITRYEDNSVEAKWPIKKGVLHGFYYKYYPNGKIHFKGELDNSKRTGEFYSYYENGQLLEKSTYVNGKLEGPFSLFFKNGQLEMKGSHKNDEFHGEILMYTEDGEFKGAKQFDAGVEVIKEEVSNTITGLEQDVIREFLIYNKVGEDVRYDSLRPILHRKIEYMLAHEDSFDYPFNRLSKYVTIIESEDHKVRLFSWDELTGGTWHDMAVIAQFVTSKNTIKTSWLDNDILVNKGVTDDQLYEIHKLDQNGKPMYMAFGWGTYGWGNHHRSIFMFSIEKDEIKVCDSCIAEEHELLQSSRRDEIILEYSPVKNELIFSKFKYDEVSEKFQSDCDMIILEWNSETFQKKS